MIKTIPKQKKRKIYICDICGKTVKEFGYQLDYQQWNNLLYEKPLWDDKTLDVCWDCWLNIKRNLQELAKENKNE